MGSRYQNIQVSNCDRMASSRLLVAAALVACATAQSNFICPEKDGYFEDTKQCDKYYDCYDGIPEERLCPDGLVFDPFSRKREPCDHYFNVDCGDRLDLQPPRGPSDLCPRLNGFYSHPDPSVCHISTPVLTDRLRSTPALPASGSTSTAESATGPRPPTERSARLRLMLWRPLTDSSVHPTPQLTSSVSSTPTPSTLTPTTAPSSTSV